MAEKIVVKGPLGDVSIVSSELRVKATASLQEEIDKELQIEDPKEKTIASLIKD